MDITARLAETRKLKAFFPKFDDRGYDAYDAVGAYFLDNLDGSDEAWESAVANAVSVLSGLALATESEQWLDTAEGARISGEIRKLWVKSFGPI
jgi:hypothetical protein